LCKKGTLMKYLNRKPPVQSLSYKPYTVDELDEHLDSYRLWATVSEIKREAQEAVRDAYDRGYTDGKFRPRSRFIRSLLVPSLLKTGLNGTRMIPLSTGLKPW
jgi:hypothetical protein